MLQWLKSISQRFSLAAVCVVCRAMHRTSMPVCTLCQADLTPLIHPCQSCRMPLPDPHFPWCGSCIQHPWAVDALWAHYAYTEPLRTLLHDFKYHHALYLRHFLTQLLMESLPKVETMAYDMIVPVPLHPKKLAHRGFNQSLVLAKKLGKHLHVPIASNWCIRHQESAPQASLSKKARRDNVDHIFHTQPVTNMRILIIDDIVTTGSTINALAKTLKTHGAAQVDAVCCARAITSGL